MIFDGKAYSLYFISMSWLGFQSDYFISIAIAIFAHPISDAIDQNSMN